MPNYVHSDNATYFVSSVIKEFLLKRGVASSNSTPYHPTGNAQVERYVGIVWKSIRLALRTQNYPLSSWQIVLPEALHSIRSLLHTTTNSTPHELFFNFTRRSSSGSSVPAWLSKPGPVMLRKFLRSHKNDDLMEKVQLLDANPTFASIRYPDGRESNVSVSDLAPCPNESRPTTISPTPISPLQTTDELPQTTSPTPNLSTSEIETPSQTLVTQTTTPYSPQLGIDPQPTGLRRSSRTTRGIPPIRYGDAFSH